MNLEKSFLLSTIEFGSTYQGTSDEYSDKDYMSLVVQPLSDTIFRNSEKASKHTEVSRYYAVERFISLILKSGFDNVLNLCAQLEQAENTRFNKTVLDLFYDDFIFLTYVRANFKTIAYSVIGNINSILKREELTGKDLVKFYTFYNHLEYYNDLLDDLDNLNVSYTDFAKVKYMPKEVLDNKRSNVSMENKKDLVTKVEPLIQEVKDKLKSNESNIKHYKDAMGLVEKSLKDKTVAFLTEVYNER
ncbi:nucleotidyltransferase [Staphylococcus phage CF7]|nr:nucleotidyltransferase [Staphylococcus phage CF7]